MNKGFGKVSAVSLMICGCTAAAQNIDPARIQELERQIKALTEEVERLKEGPPTSRDYEDALKRGFLKSKGLSIGFYGEAKYRFPEEGANVFDPHRFVLTPSYQINDWLNFNSEIEFEHGGIDEVSGATNRSRFDGEIELEQFFVDILINPHFNIRSLGIDLVPVGRINKYHEPTVFYSTERPELYREIIPSTWFEPSVGVFGKIVEGWDYQFMVSTGLEDATSQGGAGISASSGFRSARPRLRRADESNPAFSGRLHFNGLPGLDASTSFYVTQVEGVQENHSWLALTDIEFAYRVPRTGLELRGDFAYWHIEKPGSLVANNNMSATDDIGKAIYGWYVEAAYHFWPEAWRTGRGEGMDLVPFVRYTDIVTQSRLGAGSAEVDNGTTNKEFLTVGLAYFLNPNFVLKADWRRNLNGSVTTETQEANQDYFQLGAGVFF